MNGPAESFWLDQSDNTLYVGCVSLQTSEPKPWRHGFCYRKGVISRLPFEDSLRSHPIAMQRYKGKLYISDGYSFGCYDSSGWHTIVPNDPSSIFATGADVMRLYPYQDKLLVSGLFDNILGTGIGATSQFDGTTFTDFHHAGDFIPLGWCVSSIVEYKGNIIIAGNFDLPGGINDIAQWDGQQWHRLGAGVSQSDGVSGLIAVGDTLVAVGYFSVVDGQTGYAYAGYHNGRWCPNTEPLNYVGTCIVNYYDTLLMGGTFTHIGNQPMRYMARVVSQSDCLSSLAAPVVPEAASSFSLLPNPSRGSVTVQSPQAGSLRLSGVQGRGWCARPFNKERRSRNCRRL